MGPLIVVDCEAPFGVGAPSVGDMTEFGAVDFNALREGALRPFTARTAPRRRSASSANGSNLGSLLSSSRTTRRTTSSGSTSTFGATSARTRSGTPAGVSPTSTLAWSATSAARRSGSDCGGPSTIITRSTTRSAMPRRSSGCSTERGERSRTLQHAKCGSSPSATSTGFFQTSHRAIS
jgi:hypothetical protein